MLYMINKDFILLFLLRGKTESNTLSVLLFRNQKIRNISPIDSIFIYKTLGCISSKVAMRKKSYIVT